MSAHKLLIIDDDDDIRESLVALLHGEGYDVNGARNALDALTLLAQGIFVPDAILLDLFMPAMSGEQFDQTIQRHPAWSKIPVIICSAGPVPPEIAATAFAVLRKPFDLDRLLHVVRAACASR
ncbi:MAG: response regulator [Deltaproteobacteria bacterium]|nr:MAG: response regulator [Deltaproteobacteria bacterium]